MTTVGYGDIAPHTDIGKIVSVLLAFIGIGTVFYSVGIIAQHYFQHQEEHLHEMWKSTEKHRRTLMDDGVKPLKTTFGRMREHLEKKEFLEAANNKVRSLQQRRRD